MRKDAASDEMLPTQSSRPRVVKFQTGHQVSVPLPWLGRMFDAPLLIWPGVGRSSASDETVSTNDHWSDAAKEGVPKFTVTAGIQGPLVDIRSRKDGVVQSFPALVTRQLFLGGGLQHAFPSKSDQLDKVRSVSSMLRGNMLVIQAFVFPERMVKATITRAISFQDGIRPVAYRLDTAFYNSPKYLPPVVDLKIYRELDDHRMLFCTWSSGSHLWPGFVARLFSPLAALGLNRPPQLLSWKQSNMSLGINSWSEGNSAVARRENPRYGDDLMGAAEKNHETGASVSWGCQINASPQGGALSVEYGRDLFGTASKPPVLSEWTKSGRAVDPRTSIKAMKAASPLGVRLDVKATISPNFEMTWEVRGTRQVGDFTHVGLGVHLKQAIGLVISFSWNRLGQTIDIPVLVCPTAFLSTKTVMWALAVPWVTYVAVDRGIIQTRARRQRKADKLRLRSELREAFERRKAEAAEAVTLMKDQVDSRQRGEQQRGGLVVLKAEYGVVQSPRQHPPKGNIWKRGQVADVTVPVAALVDSGQLVIPANLRKVLILRPIDLLK